jgi:hypothetical protein
LTEEILPGKPYTGELTILRVFVVSTGSPEMNWLISVTDTDGSETSSMSLFATVGMVARVLTASILFLTV